MRYWLSAGRGGFSLSGRDTLGAEFYCIFYNGPDPERDPTIGWKVKPSEVPNKPGKFAELKSTNYLQNAMNLMDAQDGGFDQGVFVHPDGTLCEGPNLNFALIKDGVVRTPEFKDCLAGCTMQRIIDLIPEYAADDLLEGVVASQQARLSCPDTTPHAHLDRPCRVAHACVIPLCALQQLPTSPARKVGRDERCVMVMLGVCNRNVCLDGDGTSVHLCTAIPFRKILAIASASFFWSLSGSSTLPLYLEVQQHIVSNKY
jgi:hypothetical protein